MFGLSAARRGTALSRAGAAALGRGGGAAPLAAPAGGALDAPRQAQQLGRNAGRAVFVNQQASSESVKCVWSGNFVWTIIGNQIGKNVARAGRCLESAGSPSTVKIKAFNISFRNDG